MTRPLTSPLDAEEQALAARLLALGDSQPTPALDARIRAQAHAALRKRRPLRRWGGALAAVLALGVGVRVSLSPMEMAPSHMPSEPAPLSTKPAVPAAESVPAAAGAQQDSDAPARPTPQISVPEEKARLGRAQEMQAGNATRAEASQPAPPLAPLVTPAASIEVEPAPDSAPGPTLPAPLPEAFPLIQNEPTPVRIPAAPEPRPNATADERKLDAAAAPAGAASERLHAESELAPEEAKSVTETAAAASFRAEQDESVPTAPPQAPAKAGPMPVAAPVVAPAAKAEGRARDDADLSRQRAAETPLPQLIERARRAHASGDTDSLRAALRQIRLTYPTAALPADVQQMLDRARDL